MQQVAFIPFDALMTQAAEGGGAKFAGVAYSGERIPSWNAVIDLATTRVEDAMPILLSHAKDSVIGVVEQFANDGRSLTVAGGIHSDIDADAAAVVAKSKRGNRYQMSVGLFRATETYIPEGKRESVNGREFAGPLLVLSDGVVREVSVTPLGADPKTSVRFFSEGHSFSNPGATTMPQTIEQLAAANADLTAQNTTLAQQVATLTAQIEAQRQAAESAARAARLAAVRALFEDTGREFTDAAAAPYIAMSDEAFAAVSADLRTMAKRLPGDLTRHQAAEGPGAGTGERKSLLVADAERRATEAARR